MAHAIEKKKSSCKQVELVSMDRLVEMRKQIP